MIVKLKLYNLIIYKHPLSRTTIPQILVITHLIMLELDQPWAVDKQLIIVISRLESMESHCGLVVKTIAPKTHRSSFWIIFTLPYRNTSKQLFSVRLSKGAPDFIGRRRGVELETLPKSKIMYRGKLYLNCIKYICTV